MLDYTPTPPPSLEKIQAALDTAATVASEALTSAAETLRIGLPALAEPAHTSWQSSNEVYIAARDLVTKLGLGVVVAVAMAKFKAKLAEAATAEEACLPADEARLAFEGACLAGDHLDIRYRTDQDVVVELSDAWVEDVDATGWAIVSFLDSGLLEMNETLKVPFDRVLTVTPAVDK